MHLTLESAFEHMEKFTKQASPQRGRACEPAPNPSCFAFRFLLLPATCQPFHKTVDHMGNALLRRTTPPTHLSRHAETHG